mmetsp:Transcript_13856/g.35704  ORF Transcript_13856/g.35704 Transcript_13856/m.35704 type:complete len:361 (+) Transcript_13856:2045-3127(+)
MRAPSSASLPRRSAAPSCTRPIRVPDGCPCTVPPPPRVWAACTRCSRPVRAPTCPPKTASCPSTSPAPAAMPTVQRCCSRRRHRRRWQGRPASTAVRPSCTLWPPAMPSACGCLRGEGWMSTGSSEASKTPSHGCTERRWPPKSLPLSEADTFASSSVGSSLRRELPPSGALASCLEVPGSVQGGWGCGYRLARSVALQCTRASGWRVLARPDTHAVLGRALFACCCLCDLQDVVLMHGAWLLLCPTREARAGHIYLFGLCVSDRLSRGASKGVSIVGVAETQDEGRRACRQSVLAHATSHMDMTHVRQSRYCSCIDIAYWLLRYPASANSVLPAFCLLRFGDRLITVSCPVPCCHHSFW